MQIGSDSFYGGPNLISNFVILMRKDEVLSKEINHILLGRL